MTFHLVHRSQRDPLAADEKAPQHVLLPATKVKLHCVCVSFNVWLLSYKDTLCDHDCAFDVAQAEAEKRREEQREFGVFFDDDYDYLQHLKEASGASELVASSYPERTSFHLNDEEEEEEEERATDKGVPVSSLLLVLFKTK